MRLRPDSNHYPQIFLRDCLASFPLPRHFPVMPAVDGGRKHGIGGMDDREEQLGFQLGDAPIAGAYTPNLQHIREDLESLLLEARSGVDESPWDERTLRYKKIVFLQMTRWLPDDEAEQLCFEFARELERIEHLLAA
jgi:hypothetical protein